MVVVVVLLLLLLLQLYFLFVSVEQGESTVEANLREGKVMADPASIVLKWGLETLSKAIEAILKRSIQVGVCMHVRVSHGLTAWLWCYYTHRLGETLSEA